MNTNALTYFAIAALGIAPFAAAQDADTTAKPESLRYTIKSKSETTTSRRMMINGEERSGRRGGGEGEGEAAEPAPMVITGLLIFDEAPKAKGTWRQYHTAAATVSRPTRNGPRESKVEGAFTGKAVFLKGQGKELAAFENDVDGEPIDERTVAGTPPSMRLADLLPAGEIKAGTEFEISPKFRAAIGSLIHPIRPEPRQRNASEAGDGERGERRQRRDQGDGTEEGQRGGRRQRGNEGGDEGAENRRGGQRGGQRGGEGGNQRQRGARNFNVEDPSLSLLPNDKLDWTGKITVASIEETDGKQIAHLTFTAKIGAEGDFEELGLENGGGRGGMFGARPSKMEASANIAMSLNGKYSVDLATKSVLGMTLEGTTKRDDEVFMIVDRRGTEMEIETIIATAGKFSVDVTCEPKPASK